MYTMREEDEEERKTDRLPSCGLDLGSCNGMLR
jgi:hypothetical protein